MPQNNNLQVQNSFIGGLKTEFTGLNFPENAVTDTDNCIYSVIGDVTRRGGINYEGNFQLNAIGVSAAAKSSFKWENVGGDGSTQMVVQQIGSNLYFYKSSAASVASPLSTQKLASTISISTFLVSGSAADPSQYECTYAAGNGYLFVYNPVCEPFYVLYNGVSTMTATAITVQQRDFAGIPEPGVAFNFRPSTLTPEHQYNLLNQGWGSDWSTSSTTSIVIASGTPTVVFTVASSSLSIIVGQVINAFWPTNPSIFIKGTVTSYVGNVLTIAQTSSFGVGQTVNAWTITPIPNYIDTFFTKAKVGLGGDTAVAAFNLNAYPSNAEQWWQYRSTNVTAATPDGTFKPSLTTDYVVLNNNQAPQGSIILNAFNQTRSTVSSVLGLTDVITLARPTNGAWFQGRVWYTGINASQQAVGDAPFYTWTENIYFSRIITNVNQVGYCYQQNDPTGPDFFDELPDDGGVIYIQGSGQIYKLFPVQNGMLVFAANGIWFITGSTGIGFIANDYTVTKISGVRCDSSTSFVDVLGWPIFWNEEGIYTVTPSQQGGGLEVNNLVIGTIASYYNSIPLASKKFARGAYNPLEYTTTWLFRSTPESSITDRYQYDKALVHNAANKAFYVYSFSGNTRIHDVIYVSSPGSSGAPDPTVKYIVSSGTNVTFAEENDFSTFTDFASGTPVNFVSTFTTGYMLHGKAAMKFQVPYVYMFLNSNDGSYKINGLWNYSATGNSGKWTNTQIFTLIDSNYDKMFNRVRIRGRGNALQLKITSEDGQPFDFSGWALYENINVGI
ncbi:MAG TPA: hypothetical protein VGJ00_04000 [Rhabdochlamydiaceae bacterium]